MSELSGSLEHVELIKILHFVADLGRTGSLHIWDDRRSGEIEFERGQIVAASMGAEHGLGAIQAIVLVLGQGSFAFVSDAAPAERNIDLVGQELEQHLVQIVAERDDLFARIPSLAAVPRVQTLPQSVAEERLDLEYRTIETLLAVDGRRDVQRIADERGLLLTLRDLSTLIDAGLVTFDAQPVQTEVVTAPVAATKAEELPRRLVRLFVRDEPAQEDPAPVVRPQVTSTPEPLAEASTDPFDALGWFAFRHRVAILIAGLAFMLASAVYGSGVFASLKTGGFIDPNAESSLADVVIHQQLGKDDGTLVVLFTGRNGLTVDQPAYRDAVEATLGRLAGVPGVGATNSFYTTGAQQLVSSDRMSTYAAIGLQGDLDAQISLVHELRPLLTSDQLQVRVGGVPAVNAELIDQVQKDLETAELITFPVVAILLMLIFGSLVASALPLAVGLTSILGAFLLLRLVAQHTDVSIFALNIITMLGLGLAIDYSLFVVSRFREELARRGGDVQVALVATMRTAGRTVFFSGFTVIISLLSLLVFAPMYLKSMGMGSALAVLVGMLAALTILPAGLALLGHRIDALSVRRLLPWMRSGVASTGTAQHGFWYHASSIGTRHPGMVIILTLIPLLWLGLPFLRINFALPDANALPASHESRQVADVLKRDFPGNETQPIHILVRSAQPALESGSLSALVDYTERVAALPRVRRVDSLVTVDPRLDKAAYTAFYSEPNRAQDPLATQTAARFARGNYSLISVLYDGDPYSLDIQQLVKSVRAVPVPAGLSVQVTGDSTQLVDILASLRLSAPTAFGMIALIMFVLLFLMLGSLVVPLKAVLLNILSLSVSFGTLVWIFQDGNLADLLGVSSRGSIDAMQPVLIFGLAFGLSMDYEVFLLSRMKEHYDRTHDMTAAIGLGVQKTGGIITSAALLMVVVIGAFVSGEVVFIKQIGVGLLIAIVVDATIVRMLLVPATMRLLGPYNWWAPGPLAALHRRLGLSEPELDGVETEGPEPVRGAPLAQAGS